MTESRRDYTKQEGAQYPSIEEVVRSCARNCRFYASIPEERQELVVRKMSDVIAEFEVSFRGNWNRERQDIGTRRQFILDEIRGVGVEKDDEEDLDDQITESDIEMAEQMKSLVDTLHHDFSVVRPTRLVASIFENSVDVIQNGFRTYEELLEYRDAKKRVSRISRRRF